MTIFNYKKDLIKFLIYISITLILLFIFVKIFYSESFKIKSSIINSNIYFKEDNTIIDVNYPRFKSEKIDKYILNYIYDYVKKFKIINESNKSLKIDYEIYYIDQCVNIVFNINNSLDKIKYKNILLNLENKSLEYISNIFDKEFLENNINEISYYKYEYNIYDKIKQSNVNNHTYIISDDKILIYFYDIIFDNVDYYPNITIQLNNSVSSDIKKYKYDKYIAFSYNDGPSKYTEDLLKVLEYNDSSATFFMLGNRMKYNKGIVLKVYNSNNNIESHTYSHKKLTKISKNDVLNEINSTQTIYNEITGDNFKFIRPPYGNYNEDILLFNYPLILWNINPKDWLYKDDTKIYNSVIKEACDGCIVLLHDNYIETIEATKKLIPSLNNLGYNIVSIEELMKIKKYIPKSGEAIRMIK